MAERRPYLHGLTALRAIAALLVVAYHVQLTLELPKYLAVSVFPAARWGLVGVQIFFVLSGFVLLYAHHREPQRDPATIRIFAIKRFLTVYVPLWIVLALVLASLAVVSSGKTWGLADVFAAFAVVPFPRDALLSVEWTLRHEILFYTLFATFVWDRRAGATILALWGLGCVLVMRLPVGGWLLAFLFDANHLLFLLGMGVAHVHLKGARRWAGPALFAGVALFVAGFVRPPDPIVHLSTLEILAFGIASGAIIYGLTATDRLNRAVPMLNLCGKASYSLYLIHYPLVSLLCRAVTRIDRSHPMPTPLYFVAMVVVCQAAAIFFHLWIETPTVRWVRQRLDQRDHRVRPTLAMREP